METNNTVTVWQEEIIIPTYSVGNADKNPMFFEKRVYQGSSGKVYPHPIIEKIYDEKEDQTYNGLFLENEYLKILILPELGGRIQMAYDKIRERHFVYHNQVIKPALVGLLGPWISGGIEFNWPQHHRPSTFQPIDYCTEENEDGSKTVWTNEVEIMNHTKGMAGFTLYPGKAYLEINVQLYNRTPLPQTFLWWANPAVKVNDHYQSVFPPDVNAVFDHGKRDVASFPIANGTYYKVDYSPGTDISRYKNIPVPTSYMAIYSDYDFIGGYEHDEEAGLLHVANHHISPGKKQWTWGNGDFGTAWERNLTDEDGAYVELMTGVYTDNQPDFSWLMPMEEKSFTQYFLPYSKLGLIKNANKDLALNIQSNGSATSRLMIYSTGSYQNLNVSVYRNGEKLFQEQFDISPNQEFSKEFGHNGEAASGEYKVIVESPDGELLLQHDPAGDKEEKVPEPAKPAEKPADIESLEQLYLTGLHLEQYRHATYRPEDYYREALRRDPGDARNNNALGRWYLRNGRFEKSETFFRKAIETLTDRNPNPYDGEPFYNLGVSLKYQGRFDEAYKAFYKSTWNSAWQDSGYFCIAEIDVARCDYQKALTHIEKSLQRNEGNSRAHALKSAILRKLGRSEQALKAAEYAIEHDRFNLPARYEQFLTELKRGNEEEAKTLEQNFLKLCRKDPQNLIAYALDYASASLFDEGIAILKYGVNEPEMNTPSMILYYLGWLYAQKGERKRAIEWFQKAADSDSVYCFPNRLEAIPALRKALELNSNDAKAAYCLGCLYYDKRQHELAIDLWEKSAEMKDTFPTVHRNLGIGYFNKTGDQEKAVQNFERAFSLDPSDARVLMELDQLYKRTGKPPEERLELLESHPEQVNFRDDLYLEKVSLYNFLGENEKSYKLLMDRKFHPWEGGEGKVSGQYVYSLTEIAKQNIEEGNYKKAVELLEAAQSYPRNLGEGKLFGTRENDLFYWMGIAFEKMDDDERSVHFFRKATKGDYEPEPAIFYNDQSPEMIFYQGLARKRLNEEREATGLFDKLIQYGKEHRDDEVTIDYFAVSLPDLLIFDADLQKRNRIHCSYMEALGYFGMNQLRRADELFEFILEQEPMHFGAKTHQTLLKSHLQLLT